MDIPADPGRQYKAATEALTNAHYDLRLMIEEKLREIEEGQRQFLQAMHCTNSAQVGSIPAKSAEENQHPQSTVWCCGGHPKPQPAAPLSVDIEKSLGIHFEDEAEQGDPENQQDAMDHQGSLDHANSLESHMGMEAQGKTGADDEQAVAFNVAAISTTKEPVRKGSMAKIVDGPVFIGFITFLIFVDQGLTVYSANLSMRERSSEKPIWLEFAETSLTAVYCIELILKLIVHRLYLFRGDQAIWNVFDSIVVTYSILKLLVLRDVANISFLRALKVVKIAKILRALRVFRAISVFEDLHIMVDSLITCFPKFLWSIVLLMFILYIFAICFVQEAASYVIEQGDEIDAAILQDLERHFGSVEGSIFSLYKVISFGITWTTLRDAILPTGLLLQFVLIFFHVFWNIAVGNIVTTFFLSRIIKFLQPSPREKLRLEMLQNTIDSKELTNLFNGFPKKDDVLTKELLMDITKDQQVHDFFAMRGIEIRDEEVFASLIIDKASHNPDEDQTQVEKCAEYCCDLQGNATTLDLHVLSYELKRFHKKREAKIDKMVGNIDKIMEKLWIQDK